MYPTRSNPSAAVLSPVEVDEAVEERRSESPEKQDAQPARSGILQPAGPRGSAPACRFEVAILRGSRRRGVPSACFLGAGKSERAFRGVGVGRDVVSSASGRRGAGRGGPRGTAIRCHSYNVVEGKGSRLPRPRLQLRSWSFFHVISGIQRQPGEQVILERELLRRTLISTLHLAPQLRSGPMDHEGELYNRNICIRWLEPGGVAAAEKTIGHGRACLRSHSISGSRLRADRYCLGAMPVTA